MSEKVGLKYFYSSSEKEEREKTTGEESSDIVMSSPEYDVVLDREWFEVTQRDKVISEIEMVSFTMRSSLVMSDFEVGAVDLLDSKGFEVLEKEINFGLLDKENKKLNLKLNLNELLSFTFARLNIFLEQCGLIEALFMKSNSDFAREKRKELVRKIEEYCIEVMKKLKSLKQLRKNFHVGAFSGDWKNSLFTSSLSSFILHYPVKRRVEIGYSGEQKDYGYHPFEVAFDELAESRNFLHEEFIKLALFHDWEEDVAEGKGFLSILKAVNEEELQKNFASGKVKVTEEEKLKFKGAVRNLEKDLISKEFYDKYKDFIWVLSKQEMDKGLREFYHTRFFSFLVGVMPNNEGDYVIVDSQKYINPITGFDDREGCYTVKLCDRNNNAKSLVDREDILRESMCRFYLTNRRIGMEYAAEELRQRVVIDNVAATQKFEYKQRQVDQKFGLKEKMRAEFFEKLKEHWVPSFSRYALNKVIQVKFLPSSILNLQLEDVVDVDPREFARGLRSKVFIVFDKSKLTELGNRFINTVIAQALDNIFEEIPEMYKENFNEHFDAEEAKKKASRISGLVNSDENVGRIVYSEEYGFSQYLIISQDDFNRNVAGLPSLGMLFGDQEANSLYQDFVADMQPFMLNICRLMNSFNFEPETFSSGVFTLPLEHVSEEKRKEVAEVFAENGDESEVFGLSFYRRNPVSILKVLLTTLVSFKNLLYFDGNAEGEDSIFDGLIDKALVQELVATFENLSFEKKSVQREILQTKSGKGIKGFNSEDRSLYERVLSNKMRNSAFIQRFLYGDGKSILTDSKEMDFIIGECVKRLMKKR